MRNFFLHLIDFKLSLAGFGFTVITLSNAGDGLKALGALLFVGYTFRRWAHFEKTKNDKKQNDE